MNFFNLVCSLLIIGWFGGGLCVQQYITLYNQQNQLGQNLTFDSHHANLSEHKEFLKNVSSYCAVGWIVFYTNYDFNEEGGIAFLIDNNDQVPRCQNRIFSNYNSMRYLGNQDTDVPSVSLYSKANYHGREVLVNENGTLSSNLTFPVLSVASTGFANFTFHQGTHFNGTSWCLQSTTKVTLVPQVEANLANIRSISVECTSNSTILL